MRSLLLRFAAVAALSVAAASAFADSDGINSVSGNLPIGAGGNVVMTVTPSSNVGIGTTMPGSDVNMTGGLEINGTGTQLAVQNSGASAFALSAATSGAWTLYDAVGSAWHPSLTSSGGKVGIGTTTPSAMLDVAGGIKANNDGDPCSSAKAGTIRFNSSTSTFEGCNGTAWTSLNDPPSGTLCGITYWGVQEACKGYNPSEGCPNGYHQSYINAACGFCRFPMYFCVKD